MKTYPENHGNQLEKIGALWKSRNDPNAYSGTFEQPIAAGQRVVIAPNRFKKEAKHPDLVVFKAPDRSGQQTGGRSQSQHRPAYPPETINAFVDDTSSDAESLPF